MPAIDIAEVGAGGGSIVRVDDAGQLHVGPRSAGAIPGPACYAQGGKEATLTDANVVLGYLHPERLPSGLALDAERARAAIAEQVARPLDLDLEAAAHGVYLVGCARMARAVRAVTIERGRDARDFVLVAFGGNGPLFAAEMARSLGIGTVLVPPAPGVFSAVGLLEAEIEHHLVRSVLRPLSAETADGVAAALAGARARGRDPAPARGLPRAGGAGPGRRPEVRGPVVRADDPAPRRLAGRPRAWTRWPRPSPGSTSGRMGTPPRATRSRS